MRIKIFARGRPVVTALGILLFVLIFFFAFLYSMPGDIFLSSLRSSLSQRGITLSCDDARIAFPLDDCKRCHPSMRRFSP